jgi:hypothetical protein
MDSVQPGHFFQRQAKQATRKARISDWKQQTQQEKETNSSKIMKALGIHSNKQEKKQQTHLRKV